MARTSVLMRQPAGRRLAKDAQRMKTASNSVSYLAKTERQAQIVLYRTLLRFRVIEELQAFENDIANSLLH
jgi:hypothetical protein